MLLKDESTILILMICFFLWDDLRRCYFLQKRFQKFRKTHAKQLAVGIGIIHMTTGSWFFQTDRRRCGFEVQMRPKMFRLGKPVVQGLLFQIPLYRCFRNRGTPKMDGL